MSTTREMIEIDMDRLKESLVEKSYPINHIYEACFNRAHEVTSDEGPKGIWLSLDEIRDILDAFEEMQK